jgi:hypothetical protein
MNDQPQPAAAPPPPAPAEPAATAGDGRAGGGMRALAVLAALILGFAAAVVIAVMVDVGSSPICEDVGGVSAPTEDCYDMSSGIKPVVLILGWAGGVLGVAAALAFLRVAFTGRGGRLALQLAGAAILLAAISIAIS